MPFNITPGLTVSKTYTTTLDPAWDVNELHLVAWVARYNGTGVTQRSIMNSESMPFSTVLALEDEEERISGITASPNPFSERMTVSFSLKQSANVKVDVLNSLGQSVAVLGEGFYSAGFHSEKWIPSNMPAGIYIVRVSSDAGESHTEKIIMSR